CRRAGVEYTIIPGITSAIAAPAYAGIPVTHRGLASGFMVITGNEPGEGTATVPDWEAAARVDTLVILMGVATLGENMRRLMEAGKDPATPVACIRWGTRPDQVVLHGTVGDIAKRAEETALKSPVVTVVGEVAALGPELEWMRPGPLGGKRVVVTRARAQASDLAARLEALGAYVVEAPVIAVTPRSHDIEFQRAIAGDYDWLVVTSANGAAAVFGALQAAGLDSRQLAGRRIAAVGEATARVLDECGLRADFVPSVSTSEVLGLELPVTAAQRVLLSVSALTDDRLRTALEGRGAVVTQVAAYDNVVEGLDDERKREVAEADAITFTSASTARNLKEALGGTGVPPTAKLVSIGPQTSTAVREAFGRLDREAAKPSIDDLLQAVVEVLL
ncbi:MAG TPA: uroporphyrinogen-III synthase, partial [Tepidiformaceae bacterium]